MARFAFGAMAAALGPAVAAAQIPVTKPAAIYTFKGIPDGARPSGNMVLDAAGVLGVEGALYGTTEFGGQLCDNGTNSCGTVFMLKPPADGETKWTEQVLYRFKSGQDGKNPRAGLIIHPKRRALYGTTRGGGGGVDCGPPSCGTVFQIRPPAQPGAKWRYKVLHRFQNYAEGSTPGELVLRNGVIYGLTGFGGLGGNGTVFTLSPPEPGASDWTKTRIYELRYRSELEPAGRAPVGALTFDAAGRIVFATQFGGSCDAQIAGCGTVYRLTPPSEGETEWIGEILYRFKGKNDGGEPLTGLSINRKGVMIGTTSKYGRKGHGNVFGIEVLAGAASGARDATDAAYKNLYSNPHGGIQAWMDEKIDREIEENLLFFCLRTPSGQFNLVGAIFLAGAANKHLEELELRETKKVRFNEKTGVNAAGPMVRAESGALYGATNDSGRHDVGTVYVVPPDAPE